MRSRPIRLDFKGRTHAPSKPVARSGKAVPVRPVSRAGYFGFVVPGLEKLAWRADDRNYNQRVRAERDAERAAR